MATMGVVAPEVAERMRAGPNLAYPTPTTGTTFAYPMPTVAPTFYPREAPRVLPPTMDEVEAPPHGSKIC